MWQLESLGFQRSPFPQAAASDRAHPPQIPASGIPTRDPAGERVEEEQDTEAPRSVLMSGNPPHCL